MEPYAWTREPLNPVASSEHIALDDILQVKVIERSSIRRAVKDYIRLHVHRPHSIALASGRGKLTAELLQLAESHVSFRDVVRSVGEGLNKSEYAPIRTLNARELAAMLCMTSEVPLVSIR